MDRARRGLLLAAGVLVMVSLAAAGPSTARTGSPASPYCGPPIAKPDGRVWRCTFADEFSGSALDPARWTPLTTEATGVNHTDCRVATPQTIRVGSGTLKLTVLRTRARFLCSSPNGSYLTQYVAGAVATARRFSQAYGRFEIRAAMPSVSVAGLHSSIWMWPQDQRYGSLSGEIDINERRTNIANRAVPTVHYRDDGTAGPKTAWNCVIRRPQNFHTYVLEWTRTKLTFIYDGKVCLSHEWKPAPPLTKPQPFDEPYFVILSQNLGRHYNAYFPAVTPLPATMTVDYVRIWS